MEKEGFNFKFSSRKNTIRNETKLLIIDDSTTRSLLAVRKGKKPEIIHKTQQR